MSSAAVVIGALRVTKFSQKTGAQYCKSGNIRDIVSPAQILSKL